MDEEAAKLNEVIEAYEAANGLTFDNIDKSVYSMSNADIAGKYITITNEIYRHVSAYKSVSYMEEPYTEDPYYYNDNVMTYEVYDMSKKITKDTKPLEFTDIFTRDADYETLIKDGMRDALNSALSYVAKEYEADYPGSKYEYFCEGEHADLDKKFLDEVYKEISRFKISSTHLVLALDDNKLQDIFKDVYGYDSEYIPDGYSFGQYLYSMRSIPYEDLGYENITIFD